MTVRSIIAKFSVKTPCFYVVLRKKLRQVTWHRQAQTFALEQWNGWLFKSVEQPQNAVLNYRIKIDRPSNNVR
jgi:hypothetical protein